MRPLAQLDGAPPSQAGGHGFESCRARHFPPRLNKAENPRLIQNSHSGLCESHGLMYELSVGITPESDSHTYPGSPNQRNVERLR